MLPPIRDEGNRDALWQGLAAGVVDMVVSDHSPATAALKRAGGGDLQQAWGGISGLQVGFSAVAHEARRRGVGLEQVSGWMATRTADLVGLATKGRIAVGADADLAVYDTARSLEVRASRLAHRNPICAYDGLRLDGAITHTLLRGHPVGAGSEHDEPPRGRLLERTV